MLRYVFYWGGGDESSYFRNFLRKSRGPPNSQNRLMHDPSQIPTQKSIWGQIEQLVAIVAVCRLAILKRMPAARTSESASPAKWKDEDLGWFPNPKDEYTEFSNSILPKFYLSFRTTCPYKERFRRCFVTERKQSLANFPLLTSGKFTRLWKQ